jgi:hypothetical protein
MHRVVGDRTRALVGALTVAGLCWVLTSFATTQRGVARYHGDHVDGRCARWRLRSFAHAPWGALAVVLGAAFASDRPRSRKAELRSPVFRKARRRVPLDPG